jgi:hypothetical protein
MQTRNWPYDMSSPSRPAASQISLSFMPAARLASISAQAQVTCPILVAGWVKGRERKWTRDGQIRVFCLVRQFANSLLTKCISLLTKCIRLLQWTPPAQLPGNQKCVVEHKGLGCAAARFHCFLIAEQTLVAGCVLRKCIPVGMRHQLFRFLPSRWGPRHFLIK